MSIIIIINTTTNGLRPALPYLTNKSSTKCGNWYNGKVYPIITQYSSNVYIKGLLGSVPIENHGFCDFYFQDFTFNDIKVKNV